MILSDRKFKFTDEYKINGQDFPSFKEYNKAFIDILKESPYLKIQNPGRSLDLYQTNRMVLDQDLKNNKIKKIDEFFYADRMFDVYDGHTFENSKEIYVVDRDDHIISATFLYHEIDNKTIQETGVWQKKEYHGLIQYFYMDWIFKHWKTIISDTEHSQYAKNMWSTLLHKALERNYKIFLYNNDTKDKEYLKDISQFDDYYGTIGKEHISLGIENL